MYFMVSMKPMPNILIIVLCCQIAAAFFSCSNSRQLPPETDGTSLFTLLDPMQTGVIFENTLTEGPNTNILMYEYFYNGGGVAAADYNSDGLIDLYFTSNMSENKLYLNQGNMSFQDVTNISGVSGRTGPWKTGVATVDINGDHLVDFYVSYSGALPPEKRLNQLFINQGNDQNNIPIFHEEASAYGLASPAFSNQAYFFDYDKDQDLDLLLLNHNPKSLPVLNERSSKEFLKQDDPMRGIRLFKQTGGKFEDVTETSGISGSALTYGLGIGISDLNNDGWPDFYVSNDYAVPDYLYMNNHNGTFTDQVSKSLGHISQFSMGNDIADINNDGRPDIYTLDMLPEDNYRQKLLLAPDNYEKFNLNVRSGFHHQYMRNMLQLNIGNGTYQEIGQLAGISNTDWSWAALIADYDNDGWKDIFVTNGYYRDYTNLDFINYMNTYTESKGRLTRDDVLEIIKSMPSSDVSNYIFANEKGEHFTNKSQLWGLNYPANSNGASFADLDNDGDLDLIVNNINQGAFVFQNDSDKLNHNNYLQVTLIGEGNNTTGIGAKVSVFNGGGFQTLEQSTSRGYLSTVSPVMNFGLGDATSIDSLTVRWNSGKRQTLYEPQVNKLINLAEAEAQFIDEKTKGTLPSTIFRKTSSPINFENPKISINDFKRQSLLINQPSYCGPIMITGDVNSDGLSDLVIGGARGQSAAIFFQLKNGKFTKKMVPDFKDDINSEDTDIAIFDSNGDGHPDIYIASGGYHQYANNDPSLQDRLYINNGNAGFSKSRSLPVMISSSGSVAVNDFDNDGDLDLFVGSRIVPGRYPETPRSYLLVNDGNGNFSDQTESLAPELAYSGMITDAEWADINGDTIKELIVVGEWMPVSIYSNVEGILENHTELYLGKSFSGWWNTLEISDINKDNVPDLIVGNMGINTQFQVSEQEPAEMYFNDFDQNGSIDPIFCFYIQGKSYPYITRDELLGQLVSLRSRYTSYESYATATVNDIFTDQQLESADKLTANRMETSIFLSTEDGKYEPSNLPIQSQYAPVFSIQSYDFTGDGFKDLLLLGNNHHLKLRLGQSDANHGTLLVGDGSGNFEYVDQVFSGLMILGSVKSSALIRNKLFLGINQKPVSVYGWEGND